MDAELQEIALTRTLRIVQRRRGHRTATDDVLCAWGGLMAQPRAERHLDLGAGHGSVTLMVAGALPRDAEVAAIEAQEVSYQLLVRNITMNGLTSRISPTLGDLRDASLLGDERFDLITGSPPFMPLGSGVLPRDPQRAAGRFELRGGVEAYAEAAARWLAPGGRAVILMDGASRERSLAAFEAHQLWPVRLTTVFPAPHAAPRYVIYELSDTPTAREEATLTVREACGAWTPEFAAARKRLDLVNA